MTKEQIEYQLNRIDTVLSGLSIPEDDKIMLEQQRSYLQEELEKLNNFERVSSKVSSNTSDKSESNADNADTEEISPEKTEREKQVDNFIKNIEFKVDDTAITKDEYREELLKKIDEYQNSLCQYETARTKEISAQNRICHILETSITRDTEEAEYFNTDISNRRNLIKDCEVTVEILKEQQKLYSKIVEFVKQNYDMLVDIDRYFNFRLNLQENVDWVTDLKNK